jgi:hypothetical protein
MTALKVIFTVAGVRGILDNDGSFFFWSGMQIDGDGAGPSFGDPDFQPHTSYKPDLDARFDRWIVLPPQAFLAVGPMVMGCQAEVLNTLTGLWTPSMVGDVGPGDKIGEGAICTAEAVGVPSSPTSGGIDAPVIFYRVRPGVPALVNGVQYKLQLFA